MTQEKLIKIKVNKAITQCNLDHSRKSLQPEDLIRICSKMGYDLSQFQSVEACFVSKGGYKTKGLEDFSNDLFEKWLLINLPFIKKQKTQTTRENSQIQGTSGQKPKINIMQNILQRNQQNMDIAEFTSNPPSPRKRQEFGSAFKKLNRSALGSENSSRKKLNFYTDFELKKQINETVREIQKHPSIKKHVENTLNEWRQSKEEKSAESGLRGSLEAKARLLSLYKLREGGYEDDINLLIKNEKDALHAMNLHRLLSKNWVEYPNSYRICSQIKDKEQKRLQNILQDNRYAS